MPKTSDKLIVTLFVSFLGGMMLINLLTPDRAFSERENRYLARRPELRVDNIISGRFSRQFEEYITDEFAGRDRWVLAKADIERALLRTENNGIYFGRNGFLFEHYREPGAALDTNIRQLNRFAQLAGELPVHMLLAPNSIAVYPEYLPRYATVYDQLAVKEKVAAEIEPAIEFVSVHGALREYRDEYLYFRTDHHWTMRGAYYAYAKLAPALGFTPLPLSDFTAEIVSTEFWGTYFSRANNRWLESDTIEILRPLNPISVDVWFNDREGRYNKLFFTHHLDTRDQYSLFLDGNHPQTIITSDVGNGKKLLMFKDSYAHVLIPYLTAHYEEIHVIDLRFFDRPLAAYLEEEQFDQALFLYNISAFSRDNQLVRFR
ncbi:MAG: hypothetical protein FH749_12275 [Firmicutes bacterium]|nr:hypothetical protein [Bacillota bacterium]